MGICCRRRDRACNRRCDYRNPGQKEKSKSELNLQNLSPISFQQHLCALVRSHGQRFGIAGEQFLRLVAVLERDAQVIERMSRNLHAWSSRLVPPPAAESGPAPRSSVSFFRFSYRRVCCCINTDMITFICFTSIASTINFYRYIFIKIDNICKFTEQTITDKICTINHKS